MKRLVSLILSLVMVLSMFTIVPVTASAQTNLDSKVFIKADGKYYEVEQGQTYTYTYYLNVPNRKIAAFEATTTYDTQGLDFVPAVDEYGDDQLDVMFPILKSVVVNYFEDSFIRYNYSNIMGVRFPKENSIAFTGEFLVTADSGVYEINTKLETLADVDLNKLVYKGEKLGEVYESQAMPQLTPVEDIIDPTQVETDVETQSPTPIPTEIATSEPTEEVTEPETIWVVVGSAELCGSMWDPTDVNNQMIWNETKDLYEKVFENIPAGYHEFKLLNGTTWDAPALNLEGDASFGGINAYLEVAEDDSTVIITTDGSRAMVEVIPPVNKPTEIPTEVETEVKTEAETDADGLYVRVNGELYPVKQGAIYSYATYLTVPDVKVGGFDASVYYDTEGIDIIPYLDEYGDYDTLAMFPTFGNLVVYNFEGVDGEMLFNYSSINGARFSEEKVLVTFDFTVTESSGIYDIYTNIRTLTDTNLNKYIFNGEVLNDAFSTRDCVFNEYIPETQAPTQKPTEAETQAPTQKPTEVETQAPTMPPVPGDYVMVRADGQYYPAHKGDVFTYIYNFACSDKISCIDVQTTFDSEGLEFIPTVDEYGDVDVVTMFPVLKSVIYNFNLEDKILFNYSNISGVRFPMVDGEEYTEKNRVIVAQFKVTQDVGIYDIDTQIKTLGDINNNKLIFNFEIVDEDVTITENSILTNVAIDDPTVEPSTVEPTEVETQIPTEIEPTEVETQVPTMPPVPGDYVMVRADGQYYPAHKGDVFTYIYNFACSDKISSIDVQTTYDSDGLEFIPAVDEYGDVDVLTMFPVLKSVVYNFNLEGKLLYNYSNVKGARFPMVDGEEYTEKNRVIVAQFKVTQDVGIYDIDTQIKTLGDIDNNKLIFNFEIVDEDVTITENSILTNEASEYPTYEPSTVEPTQKPTAVPTQPIPTQKPTAVPTQPEPTVIPTEVPTEPGDYVIVRADGKCYEVKQGDTFTYIYNLACSNKISSIDVQTTYDSDGLEFIPAVDEYGDVDVLTMFPVLKTVVYNFKLKDKLLYNYSSVSGARFPAFADEQYTERNRVFVAQFKVTASAGIYDIDTQIKTLGDADNKKLIFNYEIVDESVTINDNSVITNGDIEYPTSTPVEKEEYTVYFVNTYKWANVLVYVWNDDGYQDTYWPGECMTNTGAKAGNGADIYSYTFDKVYDGMIFNNGGAIQTNDIKFTPDRYYDYYTDMLYINPADIPTPDIYDIHIVAGSPELCGSNWDPSDPSNMMLFNESKGIYEITYYNVPAGHYEFKVTTGYMWDIGDYNLVGDAKFGGANAVAKVEQDYSKVIIGFDGEKALLTIIDANGNTVVVPTTPPTEAPTEEPTHIDGPADIYLLNSADWENPYAYAWSYSDEHSVRAPWPGTEMNLIGYIGDTEVYKCRFDKVYENVIFHDDRYQTNDLTFCVDLIYDNAAGEWLGLDILDTMEPVEPDEVLPTVPVMPDSSNTVYLINTAGWKSANVYVWSNKTGVLDVLALWPGVKMQLLDTMGDTEIYSYTFDKPYEYIIFNGDGEQSHDVEFRSGGIFDNKSNRWIDLPVDPTQPVPPTEVVTEPAENPDPTGKPTDEPNKPGSSQGPELDPDKCYILCDGVTYEVNKGDTYDFTYYLQVADKSISSIDARVEYDSSGLEAIPLVDETGVKDVDAMFPILRGMGDANFALDNEVRITYSSAFGKRFMDNTSVLFTCKFKVTAESGVYPINSQMFCLADEDLNVIVDEGVVISKFKQSQVLSAEIFDTATEGGDINGDGKVNIFDASYIQKHIAGYDGYADFTKVDTFIADVNGDGKVNIFDASRIQKYVAGYYDTVN